MDVINTIFDIEDMDANIDKDWYYYGFYYDEEKFRSMLKDGIKASILREDSDSYGNNYEKYEY